MVKDSPIDSDAVARLFSYLRKTFRMSLNKDTTKDDIDKMLRDRVTSLSQAVRESKGKMNAKKEAKIRRELGGINGMTKNLFKHTDTWSKIKTYVTKEYKSKTKSGQEYMKSYKKWSADETEWLKSRTSMKSLDLENSFVKKFGYYRSSSSISTKARRIR